MPVTRAALAAMAIGTVASAMTVRIQGRGSVKYPYRMPSVSRETSERMPLQASATSRLVSASTITLPSRSTGTAQA